MSVQPRFDRDRRYDHARYGYRTSAEVGTRTTRTHQPRTKDQPRTKAGPRPATASQRWKQRHLSPLDERLIAAFTETHRQRQCHGIDTRRTHSPRGKQPGEHVTFRRFLPAHSPRRQHTNPGRPCPVAPTSWPMLTLTAAACSEVRANKKTRWGSAEPQRVTCSLAKSLRRGPPGSPALVRSLRQESPDPLLISFGGISTRVADSACVTTLLNPRTRGGARSPPYTVFDVNRPFRAVHHRHHMPPRKVAPLRTNRIRFSCFL